MAKGKFERTKPHGNVGTIGHVEHGLLLQPMFQHHLIIKPKKPLKSLEIIWVILGCWLLSFSKLATSY